MPVTYPTSIPNPSLCLSFSRLSVKYQSSNAMRFSTAIQSSSSAGFTIQVLVMQDTILSYSVMGYLAFDSGSALAQSQLYLGTAYANVGTTMLCINATKSESVSITAGRTYSPVSSSRLSGSVGIECVTFFLGEDINFMTTSYSYSVSLSCSQAYSSNQVTVNVHIPNNIMMSSVRVGVLTYIRVEA